MPESNKIADQDRELLIERVFDAPRELVWQAWTDPDMLRQWWGPRGVTNPVCEIDPRPEGKIHIIMLAGAELGEFAGNEWPMTGVVKEVVKPEKLVFTSAAIVNGKPILENLATVTFKEKGDGTQMTLHVAVTMATPEAAGPLAGMKAGWTQSIDKLGEMMEKQ